MEVAYRLDQTNEPHFKQYGKLFQEKIFQGLVTDKHWAQQMIEVMDPNYFELKYLQYLTDKYFKYFDKYRCFPTMQLLISIIREDCSGTETDEILKNQIIEFLRRARQNPHPGDLGYVKEKALDFCKRQAFKEALEQAVDLVSSDKFEAVVDLMKNAVSVGMPHSIGHNFFEDFEARFVEFNRLTCPTGLKELDDKEILDGGLGSGELGVVVAPTGVGKSHWLVAMGAASLSIGKTVVHYTFELAETLVGKRYDSHLVNISSNQLMENKEKIKEFYDTNSLGQLIIKEYPTGTASVMTIRNHLEKLKLKGYTPSVVLIDYADIMKSSKSYDSLRHELKLIYEELRQIAKEFNVPIWTASQSNREGANAEVVGLENMSEAYGKAQIADFVVGLSRKPEEKATSRGRLFIAKNRAGRDGMLFPLKIDTARSKFIITEESDMDYTSTRDMAKKAWAEVKRSKQDLI